MCLLRTGRVIAVGLVRGRHTFGFAPLGGVRYVTATHVGPVTRGWQPGEAVGGTAGCLHGTRPPSGVSTATAAGHWNAG
jgi:hypothetical protein